MMFVNFVSGVLKTLMIFKVLYPLKLIAIIEKYPNKMGWRKGVGEWIQ